MQRARVESSNLESVGYDADASVLEVEFKDGRIYRYYGVPPQVYAGLMAADSHGRYLDQYVKKAGYKYEKIG